MLSLARRHGCVDTWTLEGTGAAMIAVWIEVMNAMEEWIESYSNNQEEDRRF